jgi:hypothetical protein
MLGSPLRKPLTLVAMAGMLAVPLPMSDPVGVYAVIDRVVLVPNAQNPTAVQVWGTFSVSDQKVGDNYQPAVKGYLYYSVNTTNEHATRAEWTDLQGLAGKKTIVGFAMKWQKNGVGRVRCAKEAPLEPDVWPLGLGVVKLPEQRNTGWPIAKDLLGASAPDATCRTGK